MSIEFTISRNAEKNKYLACKFLIIYLASIIHKGKRSVQSEFECIFPSLTCLLLYGCLLGLGYRARLVRGAAVRLMELGGAEFLDSLRWRKPAAGEAPTAFLKKATEALIQFP